MLRAAAAVTGGGSRWLSANRSTTGRSAAPPISRSPSMMLTARSACVAVASWDNSAASSAASGTR